MQYICTSKKSQQDFSDFLTFICTVSHSKPASGIPFNMDASDIINTVNCSKCPNWRRLYIIHLCQFHAASCRVFLPQRINYFAFWKSHDSASICSPEPDVDGVSDSTYTSNYLMTDGQLKKLAAVSPSIDEFLTPFVVCTSLVSFTIC